MRHLLSLTLLAAVLLPATAALAQPSAAGPSDATTAPQNTNWNDVSHINGQLVPVGQTNDYTKKYRRTNISSNPIGWIVGMYGVSGSYGVNNHVAIRGDLNYYNFADSEFTGTELGVGASIYLRRTYQGPFVEPGFIVRTTNDGYCDNTYSSSSCTSTTVGPQMLFGWHWTWDSGFNVAFAVGAGRNMNDDDSHDEYDDSGSLFGNGYFRVGYAF